MILSINEIISTSSGIIITSDVPVNSYISQNNFDLVMYSNQNYINIPINPSDVVVDGNTITISTPRIENTLYFLNAFSISGADTSNIVNKQIFKFLSGDTESIEGSASVNNVYTQLKNIGNTLSTEYLLNNQEDYVVKFNPTIYDFNQQKYIEQSEKVVIYNNEIILNSLVDQYFSEYKTFYEIINSNVNMYDPDYVDKIHLVFMNNIVKWSALKGNLSYIEIMLGLYAKYTGQNIISIVEDPVDNFIYRVSSSVPKTVWDSQIKPFVHPLSWNVIYNEITSNTSPVYYQLIDLKRQIRENWNLANISYLDAQKYSDTPLQHYRKLKSIYHSSGNIEPYNVSTYENISDRSTTLQNTRDESTFNQNFGGFIAGQSYVNQHVVLGMYKELKDKTKIKFTFDRLNGNVTLDFGLTGVADKYIYEFYNDNTLYKVVQSALSILTTPMNFNDVILLKLVKDDWEQYVCKIDQSAFIRYKGAILSGISNISGNKYINITSGTNKKDYQHYVYNGMSVVNFTYESTNTSSASVTDFDYTFTTSGSSAAFISEFDTTANFILSSIPITASNGNFNNTTVTFTKPGVVTKYVWSLYISGNLVETLTTYLNNVSFSIPSGDYSNGTIGLTIFYKNGSYTLNSRAICV